MSQKFDVFLSFRGSDTRRTFSSFLYRDLVRMNIRTFKDDKELEIGQMISAELDRAIETSRFAVVVVSVNYAESPWCLEELRKIMDLVRNGWITVMPVFYGVDPCHVRRQSGVFVEHFQKHETREDQEKVLSWRQALTDLANISGICSSLCEDDSKIVDKITELISKNLMINTTRINGSDLRGIYAHMKAFNRLLNLSSKKSVRVIGIWERGSTRRSVLSKFVYENISQHFESHFFLESDKMVYKDRHMSHPFEEWMSQIRHKDKKVLLVVENIKKLEQFNALEEHIDSFGPGSIVIITTQDKQVLFSSRIKLVYEIECQILEESTNHAKEWFGHLRGKISSQNPIFHRHSMRGSTQHRFVLRHKA
ncbi:hypothetical protein CARUB_v10023488mg [Capsella rubella]|uniref:TIR domain-containing protein n=1 Tax=Capsella rubella TaxID=81985 RepID=R0FXD0_9BRAS|nr:TMV resistance protein N [Capsella rubella]EOA27371.1 hypothetical protein CARUB_v10023488mg [Capsella rubella]